MTESMRDLIGQLLQPSEDVWRSALLTLPDGALSADGAICGEWTARDLVSHVNGQARRYRIRASEGDVEAAEATRTMDFGGPEPRSIFETEEAHLRAFFANLEPTTEVQHSIGVLTAEELLTLRCLEMVLHALDLEHAGAVPELSEALASRLLDAGRGIIERLRREGSIKPAQSPADSTSRAALIAFAGR